ncbi:MAG: hypothetical protein A3G33_06095 [Omnitrophica bacterium RIFCSPLOWO2_12_FULL_44_17]|uniref:Uncharacterized protein n=1 Tax=Candidatus Danuiimicrobium aquiferis TaxID=1801832 RepID=A0A1G1KR73_9BACT|nr:MAG: hypothetical protein A3B72_02585 [Omnitrophica bacterium RIFCSPHIGHO2_02_FULL_45_28]OGW90794.1 MAG: hypothetical protein A3E74_01040 [Omnitrophica bacterium RIFCSPHIGHO2_12_FULL_44_12]OGW95355.1 MAG: hypothetical protein A3G33_06095 [Omnitrophica bacterium RIFCSPLOWO2_12_FULL_44_17]OGX04060.1 MAG: hypothetical protein A3J12_08665 [Omnitrophica bacterium RIFCSPLOWO2_02_FULL_44_11]
MNNPKHIFNERQGRYKLKKLTEGSATPFLFMVYEDLIKNRKKAEVLGSAPGRLRTLFDLFGAPDSKYR